MDLEITLTSLQYNLLLDNYHISGFEGTVNEYVLREYKGRWNAFQRTIVFPNEKYLNWFILKHKNTSNFIIDTE